MAMLVETLNSKCLAECPPENLGCADAGWIVQVCRNLKNSDEVTNFELTVAWLHDLTTIRRNKVSSISAFIPAMFGIKGTHGSSFTRGFHGRQPQTLIVVNSHRGSKM